MAKTKTVKTTKTIKSNKIVTKPKKMSLQDVEKKLKDPKLTKTQRDKLVNDYMNSINYK